MTTEQPLLDQEMLASLKDLLGEKFEQLVTAFLFDGKQRFARMELAWQKQDLSVIKDESHGVKGSARNIGANSLADVCAEIENQARAGSSDGIEQNLSAAKQLFAAVGEELRSMIA